MYCSLETCRWAATVSRISCGTCVVKKVRISSRKASSSGDSCNRIGPHFLTAAARGGPRRRRRVLGRSHIRYRWVGAGSACDHSAHDDLVEGPMRVSRIIPDLPVPDVETAKSFYTDYLGLRTEE